MVEYKELRGGEGTGICVSFFLIVEEELHEHGLIHICPKYSLFL
jgi:hypothetical protein